MLSTLRTIMLGQAARAENQLRDTHALDLIDQKIRETEHSLTAAKATLASFIQRQRAEEKMYKGIQDQIADLETRVSKALEADREALALQGAETIAQLENEAKIRRDVLNRLEERVERLRASVAAGHRRVIELKQGAIAAHAIRKEANLQRHMATSSPKGNTAQEAQELIDQVVGADDPFERGEILDDINAELSGQNIATRMASEGFGPKTQSDAQSVLDRLKSK